MSKKFPPELTAAEIKMYDETAAELARQKNVSKVHPVVQMDPVTFERKVCYIQEPNYITKVTVLNKATQTGPWIAADELRELATIKEASDAITYGESADCDRYKLGITEYCMGIVSRLQNQFKKK